MASFTFLFSIALPLLLQFSFLGARTRLLPPRLSALMMEFFPLLTSPPVFLPLLTSGARALPPRARVRLRRLLLHPFFVRHPGAGLQTFALPTCAFLGQRELTIGRAAPERNYDEFDNANANLIDDSRSPLSGRSAHI